jgi:hypothetical protein
MMVAIHKREAFGSVIQAQYSDEITTMAVPQTLVIFIQLFDSHRA